MKKLVGGIVVKSFVGLPDEAREIRERVFVEEQGFEREFDEADAAATHLVLSDSGKPVATCRFFKGDEEGVYLIGRIAVMPEYRKKGVGASIVSEAEKLAAEAGGRESVVHAQTRASGFYAKLGYQPFGEPDDEEGVPHIWMRKALCPKS